MKQAILLFFVMITSVFSCSANVGKEGDRAMTMLDFVKSRQAIQYEKVPRKVLAFYYTWYGRPENHGRWVHWENVKPEEHYIASSTHYPAKGAYDSYDPEIIDYHINLAKSNGIDGFICTWWGQNSYDDVAFRKVLDTAGKIGFEVSVYWETAPGKGKEKIDKAVNDLLYVLNNYGSHPAFMKVDGKPVIFVYGRVMGEVSMNEWPQIITQTQAKYGKEFILVADGYQDGYARIFDGIHTYNICGWVQGKSPENLKKLSKESFNDAVKMARKQGKISCITIIPGYDDTKIRKPGINAERMDGQTYKILWESAISADPDWVLITSWNEWHEGSEIEPSWEDGDKYIKITGEWTKQFKKTPYSNAQTEKTLSGISKEKADELRKLYKDKAIAVLPDFAGDSVFWLSSVGLNVKELSWQEVVDPNIFNVKNFPITVYAGYENYTQSVNENEDVDKAILKYLEDGGTLMVFPAGPFPFFSNEKGKAVSSASKFGLPIEGGWENPPADVKLSFQIDNKRLKGLPESVEFPGTGDLRWRPCVWKKDNKDDVYFPLARLRDASGKIYGDGIVYIEHKVSSPKNGKIIYSWMRMTDILDMDNLLFAILALPY
jgi:glycoprotein endo-alpha-1,2-mannosidase